MINIPLFKMLWKFQRSLVIFNMLVIGFLQFLVIYIFSSLNSVSFFETIYDQIPPHFKAIMDEQFMYHLSIKGAVAFGMNHPLVLMVLGILAIAYSARLISGEAEQGLLELLLSHPIERNQLFCTLFFSNVFFLLCSVGAGLSGSLAALILENQGTAELYRNLGEIGINLWFLFSLIAAYTLFLAAAFPEKGKSITASMVITLIFYFLHFLGSFWDRLAFLKPFNIFSYYLPQKLMFNEVHLYQNLLPLAGLTLLFFLLGIRSFSRRDIP